MTRAITRNDGTNDVRYLTPWEEQKLYEYLKTDYKIITRALLHTYMRMPELIFLIRHQECYHSIERCIDLPKPAATKVKAVYKERTIPLTEEGCRAVEELFDHVNNKNLEITVRQSMNPALQTAARNADLPDGDKGICTKMYRKTMLSWLVEVFPDRLLKVAKSAGHTVETMEQNYVGIYTVKRDIDDMRVLLKGWGEA